MCTVFQCAKTNPLSTHRVYWSYLNTILVDVSLYSIDSISLELTCTYKSPFLCYSDFRCTPLCVCNRYSGYSDIHYGSLSIHIFITTDILKMSNTIQKSVRKVTTAICFPTFRYFVPCFSRLPQISQNVVRVNIDEHSRQKQQHTYNKVQYTSVIYKTLYSTHTLYIRHSTICTRNA